MHPLQLVSRFGCGLLVSSSLLAIAAAQEQQTPAPQTTVQWTATLSSASGARAGSELVLELSGEIHLGWHVYALSQPAGGPTPLRITVDDNQIAQATGEPSGTTPHKKHDRSFGLETQFYTHSFVVRLPVRVKEHPVAGQQSLPLSVRFQTCSDRECQPPTTVHLSVPVDVLPAA